jgi:murein hydrolase activator
MLAAAMLVLSGVAVVSAQTPPPAFSSGASDPTPAAATPTKAQAALEIIKQHDQELDSLRAEQRKAAQAEQNLTSENDSITEEQRKLRQSLIDTASRVRTAEERVATAQDRLRELKSSEAGLRESLDGRRAVLAEVLAALQRIGHRPPPALFAGAADAVEAVRTAMSLGAVLPQLRGEADRLVAALSQLAQVKNDKAVERALLGAQLAELDDAQKDLTALIEQRQERQAEIAAALATERAHALALSQQAVTLKDLIGKLEQELNMRSQAALSHPGGGAGGAQGSLAALHDPARLAPAIAFMAAKGRLSLPANGVKKREFGSSDGMGGSEKGISIATRPGAQVTAPSDGWVVYAAPYRSYGQLLILNVGGGYHVILAGMERITVDLGQFVLTGEPVAVMGNGTQVASSASAAGSFSATGSSQPVLYVEFRKEGTPVDSSPWWTATENEKVRG